MTRGLTLKRFAFLLVACLSVTRIQAEAQQATSPSASPAPATTPAAASSTQTWHNPPNSKFAIVDPCGGPKELLNKFGPTPCVYVAGEAVVSAGYANVNTHGSLQVSGNGPFGASATVPVSGNGSLYPLFFIAFGVSANSQFQITAPSAFQINTQRAGSFNSATNPSLNYKQRVFFSPTKYTQLAVDLGYTAPTSEGDINGKGPAYQIALDLAQPLSVNWTFGAWWTFRNATTTSLAQGNQRGWSDPLGIYFAWSPAASSFELLPVVYHNFNPNRTVVLLQAVQLLSRRFSVAVSYGGAETSSQSNGPFGQVLNFATNGSPRVLEINFYNLINQSDLPPQPPPASPAPASTP